MIHIILIPLNFIFGVWCMVDAINGVNVTINVIISVINIASIALNCYDAREWIDNHE